MDKKTALHYIDKWANFFLRILGESDELELVEMDYYTILRPKDKEWASIFDIQLEQLEGEELLKTVNEIKEMKEHILWNQYSDRVNAVIFPEGRHEPTPDDDEVYAVMTPEKAPIYQENILNIQQAATLKDFKLFHNICFDKYLGANSLYNLYRKGLIKCYIGYKDGVPVSAVAVLKNGSIHSLEFASTPQEFRKQGYAFDVCQKAIKDAFAEGAKVVTFRAGGGPQADESSKFLGTKLGFKYI